MDDVTGLKTNADAIRFGASRRVRFSPMIYFSESPSPDAIRACVGMGFDDVLTLPFSRERVIERLARQVNRSLAYYETPTYFGPDRRSEVEIKAGDRRRGAGGLVRRIDIMRSPADGVTVLRDEARAA